MEVRVSTCDVNTTAGLESWHTEGDVLDQYETFNDMPVYYGDGPDGSSPSPVSG